MTNKRGIICAMQPFLSPAEAPAWLVFPVRNGKLRCEIRKTIMTRALVVVTMGSASYRNHPVTYRLAEHLSYLHITTVLADLLTPEELSEHRYRFDTEKICTRLELLVRYLKSHPSYHGLPMGIFGGGTGAHAVLTSAARMPGQIGALVCMDGLAGMENSPLDHVTTPTLLVHHQDDPDQITSNEHAGQRIKGWCMVEKIRSGMQTPGREEINSMASWFARFLLRRNTSMNHPVPIKIHAENG